MPRGRQGRNALERELDPRGPCSICGQPFAGFDLHDDHVMPIGSHKDQSDGLVVYRLAGRLHAVARPEVPEGAEVFYPWPCAALTHARCNLSKGATRDISRWRHSSLSPVVVGVAESGARLAVPGPVVLEPADLLDWNVVEQEAYDRGVGALRRQGHRWQGHEMTVQERRNERRRLEHAHRQAALGAAMRDFADEHGPRIATATDWRAVIAEHSDVLRRLHQTDVDSVTYEQLRYLDVELGQRRYELWNDEVERLADSDHANRLRSRWAAASRADLDRRGARLGAKAKSRSLRPAERVELTIVDEIRDRQDRNSAQERLVRQRAYVQQRSERIDRLMEGPFADEQYEHYSARSDDELRSDSADLERLRHQGRAKIEDEVKTLVVRRVLQERLQQRQEERLEVGRVRYEPLECVDCGSPTLLLDRNMRPRCACTLQTAQSLLRVLAFDSSHRPGPVVRRGREGRLF